MTKNENSSIKEKLTPKANKQEDLAEATHSVALGNGAIPPEAAALGGLECEDIINQMFGVETADGSPFHPGPAIGTISKPQKGKDIDVALSVTVDDIFGSGKTTLKLTDGRTIAVTIPSPVEDGQVIRLKGQGMPGPQGHRGDLLARVRFKADNNMRIEGANIVIDADLPLETAVMGGKIAVATPKGKVALKVAPWSNSGTMLRLKERGLPKKDGSVGDIIVVLKITLENTDRAVLETLFASHTQTAHSSKKG
ncbi:MAG: DnaJ C-terminal domain-containing protein [Ahrensia sp.]|nr:DnaJ C-terminal domain-containing protein [Ahrensia sp.]